MYDKIYIIMADGKAKRMEGLCKKKQLIEIDGERVIDRTIRQLRALGIEPVVATSFDDFDYLDVARIIPENNDHEITKFNANKKYYSKYDETVFIWGDVYFEDRDIEFVVNTPVEEFTFFGTYGEILAFKIKKAHYHLIDEGTDYIINKKDIDYGNSGTWGLLRYIGGHPLEVNPDYEEIQRTHITSIHEPYKYRDEGLLTFIPGLSIDFDGIGDVEDFVRRFPEAKIEPLEYINSYGQTYVFTGKRWEKKR